MLALLLIGGCDAPRPAQASSSAPDLSKVTLVVGDQVRGLTLLSEPSGALADTAYHIEWAQFLTPAPLFEAFKSQALDVAPAIDNLVLAAAANGTPLKIIATSNNRAARGTAILVRAGVPVHRLADLEGRQIMVSTIKGGTADNLLYAALRQAGLDDTQVSISYLLRADAFAAFSAGHADIWVTDDPYTARAEALGARILLDAGDINRGLTFYAASTHALADPGKRAALRDLFVRLQHAEEWNDRHRQSYASFYASRTGLPPEIAARVLDRRGTTRFHAIDRDTLDYTRKLAVEYQQRKLISAQPRIADIFDTTLLAGTALDDYRGTPPSAQESTP
ncbi:MAG: ABC transporter substrate-binding protein [Pseudomonas sp.]